MPKAPPSLNDEDSRALITSLAPSAAALLLSAAPTARAAHIISEIDEDTALAILGEMRHVQALTQLLSSLPVAYKIRLLTAHAPHMQDGEIQQGLPSEITTTLSRTNYIRKGALELLERICAETIYWTNIIDILNHLGREWFFELADRLEDNVLARLLGNWPPPQGASEYLTARTSAGRGAKLLALLGPDETNGLLGRASDEDVTRLFRELNAAERIIFYITDPAKYDYTTKALGDGPGMEWTQDEATIERFAGLLAEADPERAHAALIVADPVLTADLLTLMPPRSAAQICIQCEAYEGAYTLWRALHYMKPSDAARIIELVPLAWAQGCLQDMTPRQAFRVLEKLNKRTIMKTLDGINPENAARLLRQAQPERLEEILRWIDDDLAADIKKIMSER